MSDPTIIANLLQSTLTGTTQSIKKAEQSLQQLQKDPSFLQNLLLVVREANVASTIIYSIFRKHPKICCNIYEKVY